MTLFVGGAKHSQDEELAELDGSPIPAYVDPATGEEYIRSAVTLVIPHPVSGEPDHYMECHVYLWVALNDPNVALANLQDAVTRRWFLAHGARKELSTADKNGGGPGVAYHARCEGCTEAAVFVSLRERAQWMRTHIDTTGHTVRWEDARPDVGQQTREAGNG